jgi:hypothetical protein
MKGFFFFFCVLFAVCFVFFVYFCSSTDMLNDAGVIRFAP